MLFTIERICNCEMIPKHVACSLKIPDAVLLLYAAIIPKPNMLPFCCLLPFVFAYLCEQGWILREVNEEQSPRVPLLSKIMRVSDSFALLWPVFFQSSTEFVLKWPNKLSQFGYEVQTTRVVSAVSTCFKH